MAKGRPLGWERTVIIAIWMILGLEGQGMVNPSEFGLVTLTQIPFELTLFVELVVWKLFDTGFIDIRWILGCDLPMHKSGLGQNEAGVPL